MLITHRRICWPNPDAVCLRGECVRCKVGPWRRISRIKWYARHAGELPSRMDWPATEDAITAFEYGLLHNFFRVPKRGTFTRPEKD